MHTTRVVYKTCFIFLCTTFGFLFFLTLPQVNAAGEPTTTATISAQSQTGSNGWYVGGVTITLSATATAGVKSITFWLDSNPQSTVNTATTVQTFSQNGQHTLYFYAVDNNNLQETPTKTISFKIDTVAPLNWRNFNAFQFGNNHTFIFSIKVDDATSGLDPNNSYVQYSVDDGVTYGYYSNPWSCSSTWIPNGWLWMLNLPFQQGATTGTVLTFPIDVCNSNWSQCKIIKFRIGDMAGNLSEKKVCLFGAWSQTQNGNVFSVSPIAMDAEGASANSTAIVGSGSTISNFSSSKNWYLRNYASSVTLADVSYSTLNQKYGSSAQALPAGKLPTTSGYYKVTGDFTVSNAVIPANYSTTQNFATVILVSGNVTINNNISTHNTSALMIVAGGNINVDKSVTTMQGIFMAGNQFDASYNGNSSTQLQLRGAAWAQGGFSLPRSLGNPANNTTPAELFTLQPAYFLNTELQKLLSGTIRYEWREVKP